jgi:hypothetical protein
MRRAIGPFDESCSQPGGTGPPDGTRPKEGLSPDSPHNAEGMRIEPPPSEPVASGTMPAAIAAAEPPEDPPAEWARSQGLRVRPNTALVVHAVQPYSGVFVLPTTTQPARRSRATRCESRVEGAASASSGEP